MDCARRRPEAVRRRVVLAGGLAVLAAPPAGRTQPRHEASAAVEALRAGGVAVLLRHAETTPGVGDPPGFRLGDCATQRNLSDAGRAQARRIGEWFERRRLAPAAVRSSAWCRCIDTARLAFPGADALPWQPLDSSFGQRGGGDAGRVQALGAALRALAPGRFEVWVTHQVNITALVGDVPGMGEGVVVARAAAASGAGARPDVLARLAFDA